MKIAFFDSGIGGLSVLKTALATLPTADYIYYADSDNAPYGIKSPTQVRQLSERAVAFLADLHIDALVVACNTATAVAGERLRARYDFPIIGMEPAVKPATLHQTGKQIAVTATSLTLGEKKLGNLISALQIGEQIDKIDLDRLVVFAERFEFDSPAVRAYLANQLANVSAASHDVLVLGCTHFVFYKALIQAQVGAGVKVIDGNQGTVNHLLNSLNATAQPTSAGTVRFYASGVLDSPARSRQLRALLALEN
ncbi:MAG: glutamate racemase [Gammaproteobacteria bacterium]|nr:MAG: glutamate racemase [Gammaproteobacteria bacterium]